MAKDNHRAAFGQSNINNVAILLCKTATLKKTKTGFHRPKLSYQLSLRPLFLSGRFTQVLLYIIQTYI